CLIEQRTHLRAATCLLLSSLMPFAFTWFLAEGLRAQSVREDRKVIKGSRLPALATRVAFPNLQFDRPVALAYPPDDSNLLFVVEQHAARVWSFPTQPDTSDRQRFLELPDPINRGNEEGLLGLAFHPRYRENGQFYVYYSANDAGTRRSVV